MNWKQAFALGLCSVGEYKGEPVAYLYNGVRLPKIPAEVEGYKTLYIQGDRETLINLSALDCDVMRREKDHDGFSAVSDGRLVMYVLENDAWKVNIQDDVSENEYIFLSHDPIVWTKNDLYDYSGNVFAAGSDPIPVYS